MADDWQADYQHGTQLLREQRFADARVALERAVATAPGQPAPIYAFAVACAYAGDATRARVLLQTLEANGVLPPEGQELLQNLTKAADHRSRCTGGGSAIEYVGPFRDWAEAKSNSIGYDAPNIVAKVLQATQEVIAGRAAFERDSVVFTQEDYNLPLLASLFAVATHTGGKLRVVDFGGSLGSSYWQNRKLLRQFCNALSWRVVEQPTYLQASKQLLYLEPLTFFPTIAEACQDGCPDVVIFSSVLQYIENFQDVLRQAMEALPQFIVIDRTPTLLQGVVGDVDGVIMVQNVSPAIYSASYPCRIYAPRALPNALAEQYDVVYGYNDTVDGLFTITLPDGGRFSFNHQGWLLRHK